MMRSYEGFLSARSWSGRTHERRPGARVNLLVLGPQGSGKGTQAKRIAADHGIPHVATGRHVPRGSRAENRARQARRADSRERRARARRSDHRADPRACPRRTPRTASCSTVSRGRSPRRRRSTRCSRRSSAASTQSSSSTSPTRLRPSGSTSAPSRGRADDTPEAIARRLAIYHEQTELIVERYRATALVPLHADRSIGEVAAEIGEALELLGEGAAA